mmetsp:Transcript_11237/g.20529  ORF Transcript_11237/g.20529 Transcript_11237/m.20529 type:complete len:219 (+) Transcript_11237:71-727(+)
MVRLWCACALTAGHLVLVHQIVPSLARRHDASINAFWRAWQLNLNLLEVGEVFLECFANRSLCLLILILEALRQVKAFLELSLWSSSVNYEHASNNQAEASPVQTVAPPHHACHLGHHHAPGQTRGSNMSALKNRHHEDPFVLAQALSHEDMPQYGTCCSGCYYNVRRGSNPSLKVACLESVTHKANKALHEENIPHQYSSDHSKGNSTHHWAKEFSP